MGTYLVKAQRDGRFWHLYVPQIEQHTQARCLSEIQTMARDLIHIHLEDAAAEGETVGAADIDLTVDFIDEA